MGHRDRTLTYLLTCWAVFALANLAVWGVIIYVVAHFVLKFW